MPPLILIVNSSNPSSGVVVGDEIEALVLGLLIEVELLVEGELLVELLETLGLVILPLVEQLARKHKDKIKTKFFFS